MGEQKIKDIKTRIIKGILDICDKDIIIEVDGKENSLFELVRDFDGYDIKIEITKEGGLNE